MTRLSVLLALITATGVGSLDRSGGWTMSQLVSLHAGEFAEARAISERGDVVGIVGSTDGRGSSFLWRNGKVTRLPLSSADGINDRGEIAGTAAVPGFKYTVHAVLWRNGKTIDLGRLAGPRGSSHSSGISSDGRVVGSSETKGGHTHACLWQAGKLIDLGTLGGDDSQATAINDRGQVVGSSETAAGAYRAFLWEKGVMRNLGGLGRPNFSSAANAINDKGQIVGSDEWTSHAFLWESGKMRDIGKAVGTENLAVAINNQGVIVGNTNTSIDDPQKIDPRDRDRHALVWQNGRVVRLSPTESRYRASVPAAINDRGIVVGRIAYLDYYAGAHPVIWRPR